MRSSLLLFSLLSTSLFACPVGDKKLSKDDLHDLKHYLRDLSKSRKPAWVPSMRLPDQLSQAPWGGKNSANWKPEAILANATSYALNEAKKESDVIEARVAVPVKMTYFKTNNRPYNDGQTNAGLSFGDWPHKTPQLVATLKSYKNGSRKIKFHFASQITFSELSFTLVGFTPARLDATVPVIKTPEGFVGEWTVDPKLKFGDTLTSKVLWVSPKGWKHAFPVDFRLSIVPASTLLAASGVKTMGPGQSLLDPVQAKSNSLRTRKTVMETLLTSVYGPEWDQSKEMAYNPKDIHALIKQNDKVVATNAVGQGWTWVANKSPAVPFKNLYTCFDARNVGVETKFGVPSGGGWHEIGDAAETIINNLESAPIVVGMATGLPWHEVPDKKGFAWNLEDVSVVGFLQPGSALITGAGDQTWREDVQFRQNKSYSDARGTGNGGGRNYHWFYFPFDRPVCTQEWVHNCVPSASNPYGLNCK